MCWDAHSLRDKLCPSACKKLQVESSEVCPSWKGQKIWLGLTNIGFSSMLLGVHESEHIFSSCLFRSGFPVASKNKFGFFAISAFGELIH